MSRPPGYRSGRKYYAHHHLYITKCGKPGAALRYTCSKCGAVFRTAAALHDHKKYCGARIRNTGKETRESKKEEDNKNIENPGSEQE